MQMMQERSHISVHLNSQELERWAERLGIQLEFIQSGNPQQNAYIERYNRTVCYSWLSQYKFVSIRDV